MIVNQLVGKLVGQRAGPVLVVGGAPSAPEELAHLREHGFDVDGCTIISANEHALHLGLKPQFACVNDDVHHTLNVPQEPRLRKLMPETMLLSRHWWADYRSPQLMPCNSGLKAILYAAILGANPVVVIGIQHYSTGLYFHEHGGKEKGNPNFGRPAGYFGQIVQRIKMKLGSVPVRPVSGPLTNDWPAWRPDEVFAPRSLSPLEEKALEHAAEMRYVHVRDVGFGFCEAQAPQGMVFAVTRYELLELLKSDSVADASAWDLSDMNKALAEDLDARRAEQERLRLMVAKVRGSRRGIRRTLYDADIIRIIKWHEEGQAAEGIARRVTLPLEQVKFILSTAGAQGGPARAA